MQNQKGSSHYFCCHGIYNPQGNWGIKNNYNLERHAQEAVAWKPREEVLTIQTTMNPFTDLSPPPQDASGHSSKASQICENSPGNFSRFAVLLLHRIPTSSRPDNFALVSQIPVIMHSTFSYPGCRLFTMVLTWHSFRMPVQAATFPQFRWVLGGA